MGTIIHYRIPALAGDGSTAHPLHIRVMPSPRGLDLVHADESLSPLALDEAPPVTGQGPIFDGPACRLRHGTLDVRVPRSVVEFLLLKRSRNCSLYIAI